MNKVNKHDASNKIIIESKDVNKKSNSGSHYNVRVRSESISQTRSSCEQRDSGSGITECSKNNPLLSGSSLQRNVNQLSSGKGVVYKDAFEDETIPPSSLSDQHRTDDGYVPSDTSRGARPKTRSYASVLPPSKGEVVPLSSYSHSGRYLLTSDPVQELLSDIDVKTDLNLSRTQKKIGITRSTQS